MVRTSVENQIRDVLRSNLISANYIFYNSSMLQVKASGRKLLADKDLQENGEVRYFFLFCLFY